MAGETDIKLTSPVVRRGEWTYTELGGHAIRIHDDGSTTHVLLKTADGLYKWINAEAGESIRRSAGGVAR